MAAKTYMTDFEALRRGFELSVESKGTTRWNLYRGINENFNARSAVLYKQQSDDMDKDESFALLQQLIQDNSANGGDFTIYYPPAGGHKSGGLEGTSAHFRVEGPAPAGSARLGGYPAIQEGIISKFEHEQRLEQSRRMWELERKLEDMEAEQASRTGIGQLALAHLVEDGTLGRVVEATAPAVLGALATLLGKIFNVPVMQPAASVAVSGFPAGAEAEASTEGADPEHYDSDRIAAFLNAIRPHFNSHEEMYQFLDKVAAFFVKNPAMSKSFFQ